MLCVHISNKPNISRMILSVLFFCVCFDSLIHSFFFIFVHVFSTVLLFIQHRFSFNIQYCYGTCRTLCTLLLSPYSYTRAHPHTHPHTFDASFSLSSIMFAVLCLTLWMLFFNILTVLCVWLYHFSGLASKYSI